MAEVTAQEYTRLAKHVQELREQRAGATARLNQKSEELAGKLADLKRDFGSSDITTIEAKVQKKISELAKEVDGIYAELATL